MAKVIFKYGTRQQYDNLATKNAETLYFLLDTGEIYRGDVNLARSHYWIGRRQELETDIQVIQRVVEASDRPPAQDDVFTIETDFGEAQVSRKSYTYDGLTWQSMDGDLDASNIFFNDDITINGTLVPIKGKTLSEALQEVGEKALVSTSIDVAEDLKPVDGNNFKLIVFDGVTAGLVPVPSKELRTENHVLNALGEWVTPKDDRIGSLKYEGITYRTVDDYVKAIVDDIFSWETIE